MSRQSWELNSVSLGASYYFVVSLLHQMLVQWSGSHHIVITCNDRFPFQPECYAAGTHWVRGRRRLKTFANISAFVIPDAPAAFSAGCCHLNLMKSYKIKDGGTPHLWDFVWSKMVTPSGNFFFFWGGTLAPWTPHRWKGWGSVEAHDIAMARSIWSTHPPLCLYHSKMEQFQMLGVWQGVAGGSVHWTCTGVESQLGLPLSPS